MDNKNEIKMLLVMPFFYPHRGGSQKYAEEIYSKMIEKHPNFHLDVIAYNTDSVRMEESYRGFKIYRTPCWNIIPARFALPKPFQLRKLLKELKGNNYDFVNTHIRFFDPTWWLWKYAKKINAKSIYTGHVPSHPMHQNLFVKFMAFLVDTTLAKWALKKYDILIFVNKASQSFFRKKLGIKENSELIYIGVDTQEFIPGDKYNTFRIPNTQITVEEGEILVTYIGRIIWTKGVHLLFDVARELTTRFNVRFVIAGPGELEKKLRNKALKEGLEDRIILTGSLDYPQVKSLLSRTNIFVNPSHHNEGLPNTLLEAGSAECFTIATDIGGTKELIIEGETGLLIPPKNQGALTAAIQTALIKDGFREKLANNLLKKIRAEFDWEALAEKYYQLLVSSR